MDFSINFDFFLVFLNLYSNPYPKIKIFFCILNYLIQNLQKICKIPKPKYSKNWKPKPRLKPLGFIGCICLIFANYLYLKSLFKYFFFHVFPFVFWRFFEKVFIFVFVFSFWKKRAILNTIYFISKK